MSIVERIRRIQQESALRNASAKAEEIKWQQEERPKQQENARKTNEILEESGVKAALIEIRDKMTGRLFGIGGGKLRQFDEEWVLAKNGSARRIGVIGGIKLVWDKEEIGPSFLSPFRTLRFAWKEMCIYVTPEGDLLLEREMLGDYQRINHESWQEDKSMVEKELVEYFLNPLTIKYGPDIGHHAGKIPGITYVRDIDRR